MKFSSLTDHQKTLLDPQTIRKRTQNIYELTLQGKTHFHLHLEKLDSLVDFVIEVTQENYPQGKIPVHGRYEHLRAGGIDRIQELKTRLQEKGFSPQETSRSLIDLIFVSVLLDAGAGPDWKYNQTYSRSEGLAVASYDLFVSGLFSHDPSRPYQVTAKGLSQITLEELTQGFQISSDNPMAGLPGRHGLMNRLSQSLMEFPEYFGAEVSEKETLRPGNLINTFAQTNEPVSAQAILKMVLIGLSSMWPARVSIDGLPMGDVWEYEMESEPHKKILIPFHKLSQWLTYSLIEPIEEAGIQVEHLEQLTGLPEYRNGGLFIDSGVMSLKDSKFSEIKLSPSHPVIIEWRALTVQLLDQVAERMRKKMGKTEQELPLPCVLQGGTWSAGRKIAKKLRMDGSPPLQLESDGTVF